jgi:hypothetical protein
MTASSLIPPLHEVGPATLSTTAPPRRRFSAMLAFPEHPPGGGEDASTPPSGRRRSEARWPLAGGDDGFQPHPPTHAEGSRKFATISPPRRRSPECSLSPKTLPAEARTPPRRRLEDGAPRVAYFESSSCASSRASSAAHGVSSEVTLTSTAMRTSDSGYHPR